MKSGELDCLMLKTSVSIGTEKRLWRFLDRSFRSFLCGLSLMRAPSLCSSNFGDLCTMGSMREDFFNIHAGFPAVAPDICRSHPRAVEPGILWSTCPTQAPSLGRT